jgi:tetratricopeptide (TPR) repeat protein
MDPSREEVRRVLHAKQEDVEVVVDDFASAAVTRSSRRISTGNARDAGGYHNNNKFSSQATSTGCSCCQGICRNIDNTNKMIDNDYCYEQNDTHSNNTIDDNDGTMGGIHNTGDNNEIKRFNLGADSFYEDDNIDIDYGDGVQYEVSGMGSNKNLVVGVGGGGGGGRFIPQRGNDKPKFVDSSTPTLIDEYDVYEDDEEEEEMVKLEYERIRRNAAAPIGARPAAIDMSHYSSINVNDGDSVRRTPGAQMYRSNYDTHQGGVVGDLDSRSNSFDMASMRRTPGASKMHASAIVENVAIQHPPQRPPQDHVHQNQTSITTTTAVNVGTDASGLGFGLTLSSPLNNTSRARDAQIHQMQQMQVREKEMDTTRPRPRPTGSKEDPIDVESSTSNSVSARGALISPWSMAAKTPSKDQHHLTQQQTQRAYSPNTLRLTEDLGNLLLEDDDNSDETQKISQFVFRSGTSSSSAVDGKNQKSDNSDDIISVRDRQQQDNTNITNESWTTPFIVNIDQHQQQQQSTLRVPRNTYGRGRKSRLDRTGRARGGLDKSTSLASSSSSTAYHQLNQPQHQQRLGESSFLSHAQQPTGLRNTHSQSSEGSASGGRNISNISSTSYDTAPPDLSFVDGIAGGGVSSSFGNYVQHQGHAEINAPVLNFGGAFSPPTKVADGTASANQQQQRYLPPPPVTGSFLDSSGQGNSSFNTAAVQFPFPTGTPAFGRGNFSNAGQHQQIPTPPFFQATPAFGHHANVQTLHPNFGGQYPQNPMFANSIHPPPMSHSPTFNFPQHHNTGYQMNVPTSLHQHHAPQPPDFMSNVNVPHAQPTQHPPQFAPSPQPWAAPNMSMQYDGMASPNLDQYGHASTYSSHAGWQMQQQQQQQYRMHPPLQQVLRESPSIMLVQPTHPLWPQEGEVPTMDGSQSNAFNPQHRQSPFAPTVGRPPSRGKNQRKNVSRKWSNKNQQKNTNANISNNDKGVQRVDSVSSVASGGKKASTSTKGGKKKHETKDRSTPTQSERSLSTPVEEIADQTNAVQAEVEDPADAKRAELSESPATRSAFKDFYRKLRAEERLSFKDAEKYAMSSLSDGSLPESIHWRVFLELADLAKRSNRFEEARNLYQQVYKLQPYASQGWLEFSKLEEECGNMNACAKILFAGLEYCEYSENLLTRAIKHEEKRGNISRARELLSRLKHVGIEKVWRTVLEGAMLEARAGNDVMARRVLKYLMHHVPWYGPLYLEAYKLEKDLGHSKEALAVVERGLAAIPRYGPLWFGAFRLCEELDLEDHIYRLPQSMAMIDRATLSISKELIWKVHLEAAQMLERSSTENLDSSTDPSFLQVMEMSRKRFALTIISCPPNLRWKVWLAAGRMEVAAGNSDIARRLFLRAHRVVPDKGRAVALLECARLEEFVGDVKLANAILCRSRNVGGSDWKVWLESVMLAIRNGNYTKAIALSQKALRQHSGTGRLWASLIQLRHLADVEEAQFESLALALNAVPKSGEVWCEGARIHLNPFSHTFDLHRANRHLYFATKFTPQYGDGFLETLRLLILDQLLLPIGTLIWEESKNKILGNKQEETWEEGLTKYISKILVELSSIREYAANGKDALEAISAESLLGKSTVQIIFDRLYSDTSHGFFDISRLELRCANADPNYGPVWFHCRSGPTETARNVLARAVNLILDEVKIHANLYIIAFIRRFAVISRFTQKGEQRSKQEGASTSSWEKLIDQELLSAPSLKVIIENGTNNTNIGVELLESSIPPSNFIAGIVELSQHHPIKNLTLSERRKVLFGADSLFS